LTSPNQDGEEEEEGGEGGTPANETCEQNSGTSKLSPGLMETPHTLKARSRTLSSISAKPSTMPASLAVKRPPKGLGNSHGAVPMAAQQRCP
jgi:hypothetical protein